MRWKIIPFVACFRMMCFLSMGVGASASDHVVPPPASAYIMKLAASPADDELIYAATNGGGLYRTRDGGGYWSDISPRTKFRHYYIVALDPLDSSRIYTGGRETGLWVSHDRGDSWELLALPEASILSLVIDPIDRNRLYVLTPDGVHRNTHGGAGPWQFIFNYPEFVAENEVPWPDPTWPKQFSRFQHLTLDPRHPDTLFLGGRWEGGYHRSEDGGDTWRHESIGPIFRRGDRIVPDPVTPNLLYAETHHQGMFKSYNNGRSWVSSSSGIAPQKRTPHYGAVLISGSSFDPSNSDIIYAGSDYSNWKSTDAGATWHELGQSLTCEFARSFLVTENAVFAGTNVGVYRSFDGGNTWETCNRGLPTRTVLATTQGTVNGERFEWALCAGQPAIYRRSLERTSDWVSVSWLLYDGASAIRFESDTGTLVIETPKGERRSVDGGLRWDVPATVYVKSVTAKLQQTFISGGSNGSPNRSLLVEILGATRPDDSVIEPMYQRPPYVAFAITTPTYPMDASVPLWTGQWDDSLSGILSVPKKIFELDGSKVLRVEVRDFQHGTRTGSAILDPSTPTTISVAL